MKGRHEAQNTPTNCLPCFYAMQSLENLIAVVIFVVVGGGFCWCLLFLFLLLFLLLFLFTDVYCNYYQMQSLETLIVVIVFYFCFCCRFYCWCLCCCCSPMMFTAIIIKYIYLPMKYFPSQQHNSINITTQNIFGDLPLQQWKSKKMVNVFFSLSSVFFSAASGHLSYYSPTSPHHTNP